MGRKYDIRVEIDPSCQVPQVVIRTDRKDDYIDKVVYNLERCLAEEYPQIAAYRGDTVVMLNQWDILRVFTEKRKVIICTEKEQYESRSSLKELEEMLDESRFVRISRFEIVNLRKVTGFDLSISGTIRMTFANGTETWVARRNVKTIADKLNIKSKGR